MSIHSNVAGERCPGPLPEQRRKATPADKEAARLLREAELAERDPELSEAFAVANERRKGFAPPKPDAGLDRRIYVTKGAYKVSGGLPTLGRHR
jgi:hypothetical protein